MSQAGSHRQLQCNKMTEGVNSGTGGHRPHPYFHFRCSGRIIDNGCFKASLWKHYIHGRRFWIHIFIVVIGRLTLHTHPSGDRWVIWSENYGGGFFLRDIGRSQKHEDPCDYPLSTVGKRWWWSAWIKPASSSGRKQADIHSHSSICLSPNYTQIIEYLSSVPKLIGLGLWVTLKRLYRIITEASSFLTNRRHCSQCILK